MGDLICDEALAWLKSAAAKREAGVQDDKRHHERSACKFDVERARTHATISGLRLHHAQAMIARIESLTARLAEAEEALRGNAGFIKAQAEERARVRAETLEEAAKVAEECIVMVSLGVPGEGPFSRQDRTVDETRAEIATAIRALATQENTQAASDNA